MPDFASLPSSALSNVAPPRETGSSDVLGLNGVYFDPLWRVEVQLTALEQALLESWWVRRLAFVSHAGAASITTTQSYSRLEHSLGLLSLVAHFAPTDITARAAALLHDIGHLPFSHTLEGLAGLNHHALGSERIRELTPILTEHGVDAEDIIAIDAGHVPSPLHSRSGGMKLDHLESFVRSGQAHGRTVTAPPMLLSRIRLAEGTVDTDADTGAELAELVAGEARAQRSAANVLPVAVLRHTVKLQLEAPDAITALRLTQMTDDELSCALLQHPETAPIARRLREHPTSWSVEAAPAHATSDHSDALLHSITRGYFKLPTVNRTPLTSPVTTELQRELPLHFIIKTVPRP
jgi:hypothetical protein